MWEKNNFLDFSKMCVICDSDHAEQTSGYQERQMQS